MQGVTFWYIKKPFLPRMWRAWQPSRRGRGLSPALLQPFAEALKTEVFQLIAFFRAEQEKQVMAQLPGCEATRWNPLFTDIVPRGGSKQVGMEKLLAHFGIRREECMAFGDGGNDIPMLRYAGIGVAMGNAREEVKAAADYVTSSVDEDGIAMALRHFGLLDGNK